jgi:hypothetical protein
LCSRLLLGGGWSGVLWWGKKRNVVAIEQTMRQMK